MSVPKKFPGFPKKALTFFRGLAKNNKKEWFEAHRDEYNEFVLDPARSFVERLGEKLAEVTPNLGYDTKTNGSGSLMRIYRDTRFSKDKTPYKTCVGAIFWVGQGKKMELPGYYFHMDPKETFLCGGLHAFPKPTLEKYRKSLDDKKRAAALDKALAPLKRTPGYEVLGEHYKRVPRGFDPEHPKADLLRHAGLYVKTPLIPTATVTSSKLETECLKHWKKMAPLVDWLADL